MARNSGKVRPLTALRKGVTRAVTSPAGQAVPAALVAAQLHWAFERTEWDIEGRDALAEEARRGPVIVGVWHGRLMCATRFWDLSWGPLTTLTSQQYPGRLAGQAFRRVGLATRAMHDRRANRGESLALAREVRAGMSVGIAVDGPLGPARVAKTVSLDWARLTGAPIWLLGFSATRFWQLDTWDRMIVPRAGGRACLLYERYGVPERRGDAAAREAERLRLERALDAVTDAADLRMGHGGRLA